MNFMRCESAQKLRGGVYTHPAIAAFLVEWVKGCQPMRILEPDCGNGGFLEEIEKAELRGLRRLVACEIDGEEAAKAASRTSLSANILNTDFLRWYLVHGRNEEAFDAVVGNPPFIRYQYLPQEQQRVSEKIFHALRLPFTKHCNAWDPFILGSLHLLRPGGRLAMVVPAEIFHIAYAQAIRSYLVEQCSRILFLDPEEIWFSDTLQGTVLLLAEKKIRGGESSQGVSVTPIRNRACLMLPADNYFRNASYTNGARIAGKWMSVFLS